MLIDPHQIGWSERIVVGDHFGFGELSDFGSNPGNLRMFAYVPEQVDHRRKLLVVLHGCGQTAAAFHKASELGELADEHGFVVLYPEQRRENNDQTCFSWFSPDDTRRDSGEAASIRQMIASAVARWALDPAEVHAFGLSAGGAMCAALLAAYPDSFKAGAVVAGLPAGCANNLSEALDAMFVGRVKDAQRWGDLVRAAAPAASRWPRIAIWYGTNDSVVRPINAGELVKQWTNVHGLGATTPDEDHVGPALRRVWRDADGEVRVSTFMVPGLKHGIPISDDDPPAPFFLPAGVSALKQTLADFGLARQPRGRSLRSIIGLRG